MNLNDMTEEKYYEFSDPYIKILKNLQECKFSIKKISTKFDGHGNIFTLCLSPGGVARLQSEPAFHLHKKIYITQHKTEKYLLSFASLKNNELIHILFFYIQISISIPQIKFLSILHVFLSLELAVSRTIRKQLRYKTAVSINMKFNTTSHADNHK